MNKYQEYVLDTIANGNKFVFSLCCPIDLEMIRRLAVRSTKQQILST